MDFRRLIYLGIGWLSRGMAAAGIILPILPTTPMLLVAVWAFGKSSPELAEKSATTESLARRFGTGRTTA